VPDLRCPDPSCDEKDHPYFSLTIMVDADRTLCERVDKLDPEEFTCTHCGAKAVDTPDRCEHGMFFSGAGACPQCGGGTE
jgi:hypothetical protein